MQRKIPKKTSEGTMWKCGKCKKYKLQREFGKQASAWNGIRCECRECRK